MLYGLSEMNFETVEVVNLFLQKKQVDYYGDRQIKFMVVF